jgi:hypothetical protein
LNIYGVPYCVCTESQNARLCLYRLSRTGDEGQLLLTKSPLCLGAGVHCTHVFRAFVHGKVYVNVVDELILAHCLDSTITLLFDVMTAKGCVVRT